MTSSIIIIGSGIVGRQWGLIFAAGGNSVLFYDTCESQLKDAESFLVNSLSSLEKDGFLRGSLSVEQQKKLFSFTTKMEANVFEKATLVVECVPENAEIKAKVLSEVDRVIGSDTLITSSSSCIPASKFTESLVHRANCMVAHPVNPPYFLLLVEIVPAPWTCSRAVSRVRALLESVGQKPVVLNREIPGFAVNRIQYAIVTAAWDMVQKKILTPQDVDLVMTEGLGPRYAFYGQMALFQLNAKGVEDYFSRYQSGMKSVCADMDMHPDFRESTIQQVTESMNALMPLDQREQEIQRRDHRLAKLSKIKKE